MSGYYNAMKHYADFSGRATRAEFWSFTFVSGIVFGGGAQALDLAAGTYHRCFLVVSLIHFIPSLAVSARRLHDTDRTGWWYLVVFSIIGVIPLLVFYCQRGTPGPNRYGEPVLRAGPPVNLDGSGVLAVSPARERDTVAEIERLAALRTSGALTEAEFASMKARVLGGGSSPLGAEPSR